MAEPSPGSHPSAMAAISGHDDVDAIIATLAEGIPRILAGRFLGLYLTGSLSYGGFDRGSSDIDYCAVVEREIDPAQRAALAALHAEIAAAYPEWRERIEGTYVTRAMLPSVTPPPQGRPYVNGGQFWEPDPPYGNEWLLNRHVLRERGIALAGPPARDVFPPVDIGDVRAASRRDLEEEWLPRLADPAFPPDSHHEAYLALTLCRILHRATHDEVTSKPIAAAWVKERYGEPWRSLVERAERWKHGEELHAREEVRAFLRFAGGELGLGFPFGGEAG